MLEQVTNQTILQGKVITRAVLYARVSSDDTRKDGRNLQGQLEMGREFVASKGYQIVAELPEDDRGASGADIDLPQLNRIREMAHNGEFDVLIVREIDRLSRNLAKQLIIEEELKQRVSGLSISWLTMRIVQRGGCPSISERRLLSMNGKRLENALPAPAATRLE